MIENVSGFHVSRTRGKLLTCLEKMNYVVQVNSLFSLCLIFRTWSWPRLLLRFFVPWNSIVVLEVPRVVEFYAAVVTSAKGFIMLCRTPQK